MVSFLKRGDVANLKMMYMIQQKLHNLLPFFHFPPDSRAVTPLKRIVATQELFQETEN